MKKFLIALLTIIILLISGCDEQADVPEPSPTILPIKKDSSYTMPTRVPDTIKDLENEEWEYTYFDKINDYYSDFKFKIKINKNPGEDNYKITNVSFEDFKNNKLQGTLTLNDGYIYNLKFKDLKTFEDKLFIIEDMNFDGYKDLRILVDTRGWYDFYLWDKDQNTFVQTTLFNYMKYYPMFDSENMKIFTLDNSLSYLSHMDIILYQIYDYNGITSPSLSYEQYEIFYKNSDNNQVENVYFELRHEDNNAIFVDNVAKNEAIIPAKSTYEDLYPELPQLKEPEQLKSTMGKNEEYDKEYIFDIKPDPLGSEYKLNLNYVTLRDDTMLSTITLTNSNNKIIQIINANEKSIIFRDELFEFEDMNFDGYKDFRILQYHKKHPSYSYWFWNPEEEKYYRDYTLCAFSSVTFDYENKKIYAFSEEGPSYTVDYEFTYVDGKPECLYKIEFYALDSVYLYREERLVDGNPEVKYYIEPLKYLTG